MENKNISHLLIFSFILFVALFRCQSWQGREFIHALFRCGVICLFVNLVYRKSNPWVALFLLLTLIPQFSICGKMNIIELEGAMFFPEIDTLITSINVVFGILLYFILTAGVDNTEKTDNGILFGICLAGIVFSILMIYQKRTHIEALGTLTNPNEASTFLALCLPAFLRKKWILFLPLLIIGFILSRSWCGFAPATIGVLVFVLLETSNLFFAFGYVFVGALALVLYYNKIDIPSIGQRVNLWKNLLIEYSSCWVTGFEFGGLKWITLKIEKFRHIDGDGHLWWFTSNNEFIHILCEKGIFFLIILIGYFSNIIVRIKNIKPILPLTALSIIILNSCCTYCFHNGVTAMLAIVWLSMLENQLKRGEKYYEQINKTNFIYNNY